MSAIKKDGYDILAKICATKTQIVSEEKQKKPQHILEQQIQLSPRPKGFAKALHKKYALGQNAIIAEIKKGSPSAGIIRPDFKPAEIAKTYQSLGASCISVLTDTPYFFGQNQDLQTVRNTVDLPILRKDFIVDEYQIYQSRALGADCILLILSALSDAQAKEFEMIAHHLGMDVLIETHDRLEIERALEMQSPLIGINNRNLKNMNVDIQTTLSLKKIIPPEKLIISESGFRHYDDIEHVKKAGIHAFLIGEYFMRHNDIAEAWHQLFKQKL